MSYPSTSSQLTNIYLAKESDELVVREGPNSSAGKYADKRVLIVGGGVTGLTVNISLHDLPRSFAHCSLQNAWALIDAGYSVTVVSDRWASLENRITSQIAGAL